MYTLDTNCNRNSNPNVKLILKGKDNAGGFCATNCGKPGQQTLDISRRFLYTK